MILATEHGREGEPIVRNLLALIGLAVVLFAGLGWYLGWYKLSVAKTDDGKLQIKADVDTQKFQDDSGAFFKSAATAIGKKLENSGDAKDAKGAPAGTPGPLAPVQLGQERPTGPIPLLPPK
jgi:hypothetical protein